MKIFVIINPAAGTQKKSVDASGISDFFKKHDIEYQIAYTTGSGSAFRLASDAVASGYNIIAASGGDGTVNEAARAVMHTPASLAVIPRGSGNGLARHHHIPFGIQENLDMILRNNTADHDAVAINDLISVNVSGIGFDAHVAALFGKDGKRGLSGYAKLVIGEFRKYSDKEISITVNGQRTKHRIFLLAIANCSQFGNNAFIAPDASTSDGITNFTLIRKMPLLSMPWFALKVFNRSVYTSSFAGKFAAEEMQIDCDEAIALHIDGEPCGNHRLLNIKTIKNAFKLIVP